MISDQVVDVVAALPPPDRKTTTKISHEHSDEGIKNEVVSDAKMTSVMGYEHDLMLFQSAPPSLERPCYG